MIRCPKCNQGFRLDPINTIFTFMVCCGIYLSIIGNNPDDIPEREFIKPPFLSNLVVGTTTLASGTSIGTILR